METREIHDGASLREWLQDVLHLGAGRGDAILLRHAHRAARNLDALAEIGAELARAAQSSRERHAESIGQGNAFLAAAAAWHPDILTRLAARIGDLPYAVAVGALAGANGIDEAACVGLLQAFAANLISAAVRLVPLGQSTGLAVLAALEPDITAITAETRGATLDDLGGACFRSDIAAMRHETQYTRLFRS